MKILSAMLFAMLITLAGCSDQSDNAFGESGKTNAQYVLAFSWQPAFCETAPKKQECKSQTSTRYDATNFSLHGLWPQPGSNIYCGVSDAEIAMDKKGRWRDLSTGRINESVWRDLKRVMPGTQSSLHKHEWAKHGTCSPAGLDEYYTQSIWILEEINGSKLQDLFEANIGKEVSGNAIRAAFEDSFGAGAGDRLRISCKRDRDSGRQMIVEITLGLADPFEKNADLTALIAAAPATDPGCPSGVVDPAGFQ
ncbi:MAG: ribonuclease [Salaquimonas sp.]